MFNFFKKSSPKIKVIDQVWMSSDAKWKACSQMKSEDPDCLFVAWFKDTFDAATPGIKKEIEGNRTFCLADEPALNQEKGRTIIFVEHHPLEQKEQKLFQDLGLDEVTVFSSLDEPLFQQFSGNNIVSVMKQLGMEEDEAIEHPMVSKAISNAQKKIGKSVIMEHAARSQDEWLARNGFGKRK